MGKTKKAKIGGEKSARHAPLAEHILEDPSVRVPGRSKSRNRNDEDEEFVNDKLSKKILQAARLQQQELEEEHGVSSGSAQFAKPKMVRLGAGPSHDSESEEEEEASERDDYSEDIVINEDEEKAMAMFMSKNPPARRTLADIIQEKITEKQTEIQSQMSDATGLEMQPVDERVAMMYHQIRDILSKYRSGKVPKAFKIIPSLRNWEQMLYLTEPDKWSAAAMYQATRLFAANLNGKMAQRYFNLVLLPRIRDDIAEYKRLNFHLYMSIRKAFFKPAAFFKGVLLPLCESGTCTLREATILSSILAKQSIPMLHSAATILKLAEMDYNGANSIFLRTLLDKKYALPYRVVDAVVFHFLGFQSDKRELPVLWHQALLTFVQRYKQDISSEQKEALYALMRVHAHDSITPEVRRELINSQCRDAEDATPKDDLYMGD